MFVLLVPLQFQGASHSVSFFLLFGLLIRVCRPYTSNVCSCCLATHSLLFHHIGTADVPADVHTLNVAAGVALQGHVLPRHRRT